MLPGSYRSVPFRLQNAAPRYTVPPGFDHGSVLSFFEGGVMATRQFSRGRYFEDFEPGAVYRHHWGRTITDAENALFSTWTMNVNPIHFNREHARALGYETTPVNPMLVMNVVFGLSVEDLSEKAIAHLGYTIMRRAHEDVDSAVIGDIQQIDNFLDICKAHGLRPRLFLGHVIDAEELVVAEQQPIHHGTL